MQTSNPVQLNKIINAIFLKLPVGLIESDARANVKIIGYQDSVLEVEHDQPASSQRVLHVQHKDFDMKLECQLIERSDSGSERLKPQLLHVDDRVRREARFAVSELPGEANTVSGCVQLSNVFAMLSSVDAKRDAIIKFYSKAMTERMPESTKVDVVLRKTKRLDPIFKILTKFQRPLFAPDRNDTHRMMSVDAGKFVPSKDYQELLRVVPGSKNVTAEICEPLYLRGLIVYGYIQIYSQDILEDSHYEVVEKLARRMEKDFLAHGSLPTSNTLCKLDDVSPSGLSFFYPHRSGTQQSFMPGDDVIFDLCFEPPRKMTLVGTIKNIKSLENSHRFGIQLKDLQPEQSEFLIEYVNRQRNGS